jgi:hypothetical protein
MAQGELKATWLGGLEARKLESILAEHDKTYIAKRLRFLLSGVSAESKKKLTLCELSVSSGAGGE